MSNREPTYLGDGLYAAMEGAMVKLYTSDGFRETNVVFLEPEVLTAFLRWLES